MGAKEYCRFLAVCTACVGCAAFVSMLFVYYGRRAVSYTHLTLPTTPYV